MYTSNSEDPYRFDESTKYLFQQFLFNNLEYLASLPVCTNPFRPIEWFRLNDENQGLNGIAKRTYLARKDRQPTAGTVFLFF